MYRQISTTNNFHCMVTVLLSMMNVGEKTWLAGPHPQPVGSAAVRAKVYSSYASVPILSTKRAKPCLELNRTSCLPCVAENVLLLVTYDMTSHTTHHTPQATALTL